MRVARNYGDDIIFWRTARISKRIALFGT